MQPAGSSEHGGGERRARHSSGGSIGIADRSHNEADIKSQFLADLRRLGRNIPNNGDSNSHAHSSLAHQHATASSTTNSPPAPAQSAPATTPTDENNLPPRKRKVSQEIHVNPRSPYNGIHESESVKKESPSDPENNPASVDCRN